MHLVVIFGPSAVGKMTVGREVAARTGFKLFHNHLSIDPILAVFEWSDPPFRRLVDELRRRVIEEAAAADLPGLIFTCVWNLADEREKDMMDALVAPVHAAGGQVSYVELYADQETRLNREGTPIRLEHKSTKRDVDFSKELLLWSDEVGTLNSNGDFHYPESHLVIDNTDLAAADAADKIVAWLGVTPLP